MIQQQLCFEPVEWIMYYGDPGSRLWGQVRTKSYALAQQMLFDEAQYYGLHKSTEETDLDRRWLAEGRQG